MASDSSAPELKPGALFIAQLSWDSFGDALKAMPTLFISAVVLYGAMQVVEWKLYGLKLDTLATGSQAALVGSGINEAVVLLITTLQAVVLAAVAVPIHRAILRDEKADAAVAPFRARTLRFMAWLVGLQLLWTLMSLPALVAPMLVPQMGNILSIVLGVCVVIPIVICATRLSLMFPALAVDAPSAGWADRAGAAWALSRGRFWRIFGSGFLAVIPVVALVLVASLVSMALISIVGVGEPGGPSPALGIAAVVGAIAQNLMHVAGAALGAAALSWNYGYAMAETTLTA